MKKKINGLLLALAVCAIPSYGGDWEDDRVMQEIMKDTLRTLHGKDMEGHDVRPSPLSQVENAVIVLKIASEKANALLKLSKLMEENGLDMSSKTDDEIQKMVQERIKLLEEKIKATTPQENESTDPKDHNTSTHPQGSQDDHHGGGTHGNKY